jgi:hypothetical protein
MTYAASSPQSHRYTHSFKLAKWIDGLASEAHLIATAGGAGPGDSGFANGRVGLVRMRHGPNDPMHGLNLAQINARNSIEFQ